MLEKFCGKSVHKVVSAICGFLRGVMNKLSRGLSYLLAANFQMFAILGFSWWLGDYLNKHYPLGFNWYAVTFPFGLAVIAHTFYLVIKSLARLEKSDEKSDT